MPDACTPEAAAGSAPKSGKQGKQLYTCRICGTKLSRIAHLRRHQLQHSSPKESFQCDVCNKKFNRKDVYQRHLRAVHDPKQAAQKKGWKKSCQLCIRYKLKCSRELPCTSCLRKQASCTYDSLASGPTVQSQSRAQVDLSWDITNERRDTERRDQNLPVSPDYENPSSYLESECLEPSLSLPGAHSTADAALLQDGFQSRLDRTRPAFLYNEFSQQPIDMVSQNYPQISFSEWDSQNPFDRLSQKLIGPTPGEENYEWLDGLSLDLEAFDSNMFRASRMDWLGCETNISDQHTLPPAAGDMQTLYNEESPNREDLMARAASSNQPFVPLQKHKQPQLNLESSDKNECESWPGVLDRGGNESWPFDYTSNKGFRKIKLPPLREVLEQTVGNLSAIEANTVKDLIKVLSAPFIPSLNDTSTLEAFPAVAFLGQLVKTYFAEFHPAFSIIHVPTWQIEKCPNALLTAMACIGATYSTAEGSQEVATLLAEINQRTLFWMSQSDSRSYRNPVYIAASCLHQIYALGSGNRRLYELADASRGYLVTGLRELGVFSSDTDRSENNVIDYQGLKKMDYSILERAWNRWRDTELERRIAWTVFEFDCTLATLTSKRGAFSISELPIKLPCSESLWEAPSANAWASVVAFSASPPGGISFYPLLRNIMTRKTVPNMVPAWAKRICALVISRLLWDLREIEDILSSKVLGLPSLVDTHKATRENLLASLSAVNYSLSRPTCTNDVVNMNIACLATNYAYLNSGGETMDLVTFIFRNNYAWKHGPSDSPLAKELSRAREHLCLRFTRNPVATRRSVHHAALVVGVSRECTSFTPCETMRVFFSFAFLLAFAKFFPFDQAPSTSNKNPPVRLDELPIEHFQTRSGPEQLERWIEHGGPASLGSVNDICNAHDFRALKEAALSAMDSLRVWGLAEKFHRILKNFNDD